MIHVNVLLKCIHLNFIMCIPGGELLLRKYFCSCVGLSFFLFFFLEVVVGDCFPCGFIFHIPIFINVERKMQRCKDPAFSFVLV